MHIRVRFSLERLTKGAVRYSELGRYPDANATFWVPTPDNELPIVGTLYIRKKAFGARRYPEALDVVIEIVDLDNPDAR